jgi:hypothetical protein
MSYDIIGDIHGHADALKALLAQLGYREHGGAWRHPERQTIFLGDFIDRGHQQTETLDIVRRMMDTGRALAVMGNHEFNAIAWFLPNPRAPGDSLRSNRLDKNRRQHSAFLNEVADKSPRHKSYIDWFLSLPLWLELPGLNIVHACWHPDYLAYLAPRLDADRCLNADLMVEATQEPEDAAEKNNSEPSLFKAVEALLKGIEIPLPHGSSFLDPDGHARQHVRIRWWDSTATTYDQVALSSSDTERAQLPKQPLPEPVHIRQDHGKLVFIGHYWMTGQPEPLSDSVICVDYSVAKRGKLVAYRWDGEATPNSANFLWVGK